MVFLSFSVWFSDGFPIVFLWFPIVFLRFSLFSQSFLLTLKLSSSDFFFDPRDLPIGSQSQRPARFIRSLLDSFLCHSINNRYTMSKPSLTVTIQLIDGFSGTDGAYRSSCCRCAERHKGRCTLPQMRVRQIRRPPPGNKLSAALR